MLATHRQTDKQTDRKVLQTSTRPRRAQKNALYFVQDPLVLVTGASGFVGAHCVLQLLEAGYRVRGTVQNRNDQTETRPLERLQQITRGDLELVEADLLDQDTWTRFRLLDFIHYKSLNIVPCFYCTVSALTW